MDTSMHKRIERTLSGVKRKRKHLKNPQRRAYPNVAKSSLF